MVTSIKLTRKIRISILLVGVVLTFVSAWQPLQSRYAIWTYERSPQAELPAPTPSTITTTPSTAKQTASRSSEEPVTLATLPDELNLSVPFTSQAPFGTWDVTHEEYCEEASLLMAARYFSRETISSPADADQALRDIMAWENEHLGKFESTNAEETAQIGREYFQLNVTISTNTSVEELKRALAEGALVLIPADGRALGNPYFRAPGPRYHMLVLKGYTIDGRLITNDPGTRRGADFLYDPDTLSKAIHDYNNGDVPHGTPLVLIVRA